MQGKARVARQMYPKENRGSQKGGEIAAHEKGGRKKKFPFYFRRRATKRKKGEAAGGFVAEWDGVNAKDPSKKAAGSVVACYLKGRPKRLSEKEEKKTTGGDT